MSRRRQPPTYQPPITSYVKNVAMANQSSSSRNENSTMAPRSWLRCAPYWAICLIMVLLFFIAVVIILSLIPIYLGSKGSDINLASERDTSTWSFPPIRSLTKPNP
ncbi:hypothetical protein I4U23_011324 [Adineta vaga]|nr:hypothetical protein I4U23_011324 [Adineta vaga]